MRDRGFTTSLGVGTSPYGERICTRLTLHIETEQHATQTTTHEATDEHTRVSIVGDYTRQSPGNHHWYEGGGGQIIDEVRQAYKSARAQRIVELWDRWHLNDMRAGCAHQGQVWKCHNLTADYHEPITEALAVIEQRRALPADEDNVKAIAEAAKELDRLTTAQANAHPEPVSNGWPVVYEEYGEHRYPKRGDSCHVCGRNRWDEPSDWCHETEPPYQFGRAWLYEPVPDEVLAELRQLFGAPEEV